MEHRKTTQDVKQAAAMVFEAENARFIPYQISFPKLNDQELLVRVLYATICTSDLHTYFGRRSGPVPCVLGHEIIGEIVALGSEKILDYEGNRLVVGDRITWSVFAHDHDGIMAKRGFPQKSPDLFKYGHQAIDRIHPLSGGFATHCHLKAGTDLFRIPPRLSVQESTPLNCTHATVAGALRLAGDLTGKNVLVIGAGMLGLSASAMCKEAGSNLVALSEKNTQRITWGAEFGVDLVLESDSQKRAQQLAAVGGIDVVIDTSGNPEAMEAALQILNIGGISIWVGAVFKQRDLRINAEFVLRRLITIKGLHNYIPEDLYTAIRFLEKYHTKYPFYKLVSQTYDLKDLDRAFAEAETSGAHRIGVQPTGIVNQNHSIMSQYSFQLIVFDMAGTTVDEDNVVYKTLQFVINQQNFPCTLEQVLAIGGGKEKRNAIRDILIELGVGQPDLELITDKAFSEFKKNLSHAYRELQVRSCHGAEDVFFRLRSRGIKVVLNTGYNRDTAQLLVDKLGWQMGTDFDLLVTASDVENSRPLPDMIHFAMEKLAITEASSVMKIGDSAIDILEGKNAGCRLNIGITSGAQTREQLEQAEPDAIIDRLEELFQWIDE
ncbi:MAG: phosphonatase-like hydrolase [Cyclobacterium sp.]